MWAAIGICVGSVAGQCVEGGWAGGRGRVISMHMHNVAVGMGKHDLEAEVVGRGVCAIWRWR